MKRLDYLMWRIAAWICVALVLVSVSRITGAFDGLPTPHLLGWIEGLVFSIPSAWTCFEIAEIDHENH